MKDRKILRSIKKMAKLNRKTIALREKVSKNYFFEDLMSWDCNTIYTNCTVKDGILYDNKGEALSNDGRCMDEKIPYFVNQHTGYCEDDFYGTMYVKVDNKNTFIAISYEC